MTPAKILRPALAACALVGALLVPAAPALADDQDAPRCEGLPDGNYTDPNNGQGFWSCADGTRVYALPCAWGENGRPLYFVDGSGPSPRTSRCESKKVAGADAGRTMVLKAGAARYTPMNPPIAQGLTAEARREDGSPIFGARITFRASDGTHLCAAYTDRTGRAVCDSEPLSVKEQILRRGYSANFAGSGDGAWLPAEAQGTMTRA